MDSLHERFDKGSLLVIVITFFLFIGAVFTKGLTHDLFLEGGVFLVAVKLILMASRGSVSSRSIERKLDRIEEALEKLERPMVR